MRFAEYNDSPYYAKDRFPDLIIRISFVAGRIAYYQPSSPFTYRFGVSKIVNYAYLEFVDRFRVLPGDTADAYLWLLQPNYHRRSFSHGMEVEVILRDNGKVGSGAVQSILTEQLTMQS